MSLTCTMHVFTTNSMSGKMSKDEAYANFLATFEGVSTTKDGKVTPQEWLQYYSMISSSIDEDDYFEVRTYKCQR
jgi:hypothetical protein